MLAAELFLPLVTMHLVGVSDPVALQALRLTCVDFCRRTNIVQQVLAAQNIVAGTQDYTVFAPTDMVLARVLGVAWQGHWLTSVSPDEVRSDVALRGADIGAAQVRTGDPKFFFLKTPASSVVSLYPLPDTALTGGLLVKASFMPTMSAATVDDVLYTDWAEGVAAGAVARLKAVTGMPFSGNPTPHAIEYERAVSAAKRQALLGKQANQTRVAPRRFA